MFGLQAASNSKNLDIGANLFIGNLDPEIDEKLLYDTFSAFGVILETPKVFLHVMRKYTTQHFSSECMLQNVRT